LPVFDEILEGVEHRFCLRHLYNNYKKKFRGGVLIRDLMMAAAKATYYQAWEAKMEELKKINQEAHNWLVKIPTKCWCKHAFSSYPKCDVVMNNLSESFNSTILLARDKPILTMMEWIRTYLMSRFANLREKVSKYQGDVMPKPRNRLNREIERSGNWMVVWAGGDKFEVTQGFTMEKFVVDLKQLSCTCWFWELVGIPCRHVVTAINYRLEEPENYVHRFYKKAAYQRCYGEQISPINGQPMWPKTNSQPILPPSYKTPAGRPRKLRRREADETVSHSKINRRNLKMKCTRCDQFGHNIRGCKSQPKKTIGVIPVYIRSDLHLAVINC